MRIDEKTQLPLSMVMLSLGSVIAGVAFIVSVANATARNTKDIDDVRQHRAEFEERALKEIGDLTARVSVLDTRIVLMSESISLLLKQRRPYEHQGK